MSYSKDTRTLQTGDIYVAIRGERYDGHAFVDEAIRKGASAVVVEQSFDVGDLPSHVAVTSVDDSVTYLAEAACDLVEEHGPEVVAITGSVGKTSTKNAIATVLGTKFDVLASEGNFNTVLGLALTVLNGDFDGRSKLVLEMGACQEGDITELCGYFRPTVAVVTNVYGVHLETFGTLKTVARTKGEIVAALESGGTACLNADDPLVRNMAERHGGRTIFFGEHGQVTPRDLTVDLPLLGNHAVQNALAAFAVGRALGLEPCDINAALVTLKPEKGRLQKLPGINGITLVDDSYNASPASTLAALDVLQDLHATRAIAFLGDMLELGGPSHVEHVRILEAALDRCDDVYPVGPLMGKAARQVGLFGNHFESSREAALALREEDMSMVRFGDVVLVKGSQGTRMERISRALLSEEVIPEEVLPRQDAPWLAGEQ